MILRVTVENLYSFKEETEICFIAGKGRRHYNHVAHPSKAYDISVLKAGVIYGANGSGKSNVIKAINVLKKIALNRVPRGDFEPFKLSSTTNKPSKIEMEFKVGYRYYAYGVSFSVRGIVEEWLYEINKQLEKEIFYRKMIDGNASGLTTSGISLEESAKQHIDFINQATTKDKSFLHTYVDLEGKGLDDIKEVHNWMKEKLTIIFPNTKYTGLPIRVESDTKFAETTKSLLKYFNTGIVDIRRIKIGKEEVGLPRDMINDLIAEAEPNTNFCIGSTSDSQIYFFEIDKDGRLNIFKQCTIHKSDISHDVNFEMCEESDGSLRLLDFIPMLINLSLKDTVYLIDEIDRSIHPLLSQKILEYYFENLSPERATQLIFTTHESHLLDLKLLRTDEIWFVEKDADGASHLSSLAEYMPREDVRRGYLQGRYGAIPFFAPIKNLKL